MKWEISIHAPPRGATHIAVDGVHLRAYFNSRPSARGDPADRWSRRPCPISIHAPPRGATEALRLRRRCGNISIHAPPRGATPVPIRAAGFLLFQFTPLREGRPLDSRAAHDAGYFNSRPSARGDFVAPAQTITLDDFNSRPSARGDRQRVFPRSSGRFQFTPLREGRRRYVHAVGDAVHISIHAPPRGATWAH